MSRPGGNQAVMMRSKKNEHEPGNGEASATRGADREEDKDEAFLKFTGIAIAGLVLLGVLSVIFGEGTQIVNPNRSADLQPAQLALADDSSAEPDWDLLGAATEDTCRQIGVNDSISFTGVDNIWVRVNEQWVTRSSGLEFEPFAQVVAEDGTSRSSGDVPQWLVSDRARLSYLLDCYETVHPVDQGGTPTAIDSPNRVVESSDLVTADFSG